ncbi:tripartite tricarboxylate transporter permease [Neorhizobium galegae]|uniref:tripartite tricarboxylate transporter permease n=1 Tax=Neorhizobium galegae TaxID=399 RepID=UPI0006216C00|nr:tripartite tricarboxylate transporter permease [Neorhizobium galegae]CDZ60180.1 Tricarboxylate transport membrane protein TctA [Neorhizobium galegae bv. orientalis]KAB1121000.1 tripartite tricarboxylate transporter permease [Neorhizobium galegae]MCQ1574558.1 tripartite tricarboxylate transporter permease [Neorhizobium galegae]MCQ1810269.1 tripartite tricarboxylate transporter permease [Neorhizobium galegae]CDZ64676.1 Tricarboxylate transport membrane protein TctA [Neorhizobium galegae bv. o
MVIVGSAVFGLFIGAIPGLTATMATALLVPVTFYMDPVPAVAAMVTASAMAMFAGDIPSALLRMPGTPASAAYTDDAYALTKKGRAHVALCICLLTSAIGGIFGAIVLSVFAPPLAMIALKFSSFEYFWLCLLGLTTSAFIMQGSPIKGIISLALGLLVSTIGIDAVSGVPRFTFDSSALIGGVSLVPVMIGVFAIAEILRFYAHRDPKLALEQAELKGVFSGQAGILWRQRKAIAQGNILGTIIGIVPGAGADIAAWVSYSLAKKFSKNPQEYGRGSEEGLAAAGAANNAAVSGAYVPALVFGIPGDAITAIVIGVLFMKGVNPGPTIFLNNPATVYGIFMAFILANLLMIPLGWVAIRCGRSILKVKLSILMPIILMFCMVGSFAVDNTITAVGVALAFGVLGNFMEENGIPIAPFVLGIVLCPLVEQNFLTSMMKSGGSLIAFFDRPIAAVLGVITLPIWASPIIAMLRRQNSRSHRV